MTASPTLSPPVLTGSDTPVYTDLAGLTALKRGAANHDPAAIRKVAEQFESLFTRMMLKSMREATGPDPMFGSDQQQMYQSMADDQLSVQLSRGRGLGLADMLIRQLQKMGVSGAAAAAAGHGSGAAEGTPSGVGTISQSAGAAGVAAYSAAQRVTSTVSASGATSGGASSSSAATPAVQSGFVQELWPHAQEAGRQLGVDPRSLIAQAALETNWGRNLPQDASGRSSNNLFGIKASADWGGATVTSATREYQDGTATDVSSRFRAYGNAAQSFKDYVALLRNNPRYAGALNTGGDVQAFAAALQRGGYATDPDYARKINAIARGVPAVAATAQNVTDLKLASAAPISINTGVL
ncbi:MAG TPA: flagellar assembly peptidoglycan hydrolase FlgJ [Steroidobacteraceae bacterium]|nr:flagellar assembly peptidoglycan hydrolase FlgJ [Steroidobacteraceae bacterium]